jgi:hypothetical protein
MTVNEFNKDNNKLGVDAGQPAAPVVNWDDSQMRTSYANVVNASSTREEVALFFGTNLTWNPGERREFNVRLNDRVVLSPYAAKRLWMLLGAILREYETRVGPLNIDTGAGAGAGQQQAGAAQTQTRHTVAPSATRDTKAPTTS